MPKPPRTSMSTVLTDMHAFVVDHDHAIRLYTLDLTVLDECRAVAKDAATLLAAYDLLAYPVITIKPYTSANYVATHVNVSGTYRHTPLRIYHAFTQSGDIELIKGMEHDRRLLVALTGDPVQ